jgi:hypothetical protein
MSETESREVLAGLTISLRMLNSLAANLDLPRIMLQPNLHRVDYRLMFPALHTAFLTRRTLLLH